MCKTIKINLTAEIILIFLASIFPITVTHAQETNIIKGMQSGIVPEVIILQSESQAVSKKPPPQITTQTYSEKYLSRLARSLIFVGSDPDKCEIIEMDVRSGAKKVLYQPKRCFPRLIVFSRTKFILVYLDTVQEISLSPVLKEGPIIKHPKPVSRKDTNPSKYSYAGYDEKGELSVVMAATYPWDDEHSFLYKYRSGSWVLMNEKKCGRFEWCGYKELYPERENAYFWRDELNPWHEKQNNNPYVTQRKITPIKNWQEGDRVVELTFEFSNRKSVLSIYTIQGGDTGSTLTMGITLKTQDKEEIEIVDRQGSASLMGRYLINYNWGYAQELYDLETGEVIRELFASSWVYE